VPTSCLMAMRPADHESWFAGILTTPGFEEVLRPVIECDTKESGVRRSRIGGAGVIGRCEKRFYVLGTAGIQE
jgi:hypothetical protein